MDQPKRPLKVKMMDLEAAFSHHDPLFEHSYYLDLETGEVALVDGETRRLLEQVYETHADPNTGAVDWPSVLAQLGLHDWQKDALLQADEVEAGYGTRFIAIPQEESYAGYNEMVAFIHTVTHPRLREKLERAIQGRGAFRYFKDVLYDHPQERERWFKFEEERQRRRVLDWLEGEGIEPI